MVQQQLHVVFGLIFTKSLLDLVLYQFLGERCLWGWFSKELKDETNKYPRLIGAIGGHVDDFHVVGDPHSQEMASHFSESPGSIQVGNFETRKLPTCWDGHTDRQKGEWPVCHPHQPGCLHRDCHGCQPGS